MSYTTVVTLIFLGYALVELRASKFWQAEGGWRDGFVDVACALVLPLVVIPTILNVAPRLLELVVGDAEDALAHWPAWAMFGTLLLADDLTQYLYHRASHANATLWHLHRAHHSAPYMSVRITYRNNFFYYAMMPGLWLSALLLHAGFASVYYWYAIFKMLIVMGAHSSVPWDAWLIARPRWGPVLWILERLFSTPCTHAAHHGRHAVDPATYYKGNYGNFLFLWDVLFGTAKITRRFPATYGLENVTPATAGEELMWPLIRSR